MKVAAWNGTFDGCRQIQHGQRLHVLRGAKTFVLCDNGSLLDRVMMLRFVRQRLRGLFT